ncbi:hypothetical protein [Bifidobacterium mongoliense]|uniref:hypothetical protein n=1 Tax=Bifidobacterium mongoliense TaxID=518643 RepID=UPI002A7658BA|nr:hypothetical protein [Bifidobacterium mongoliense]MDY3125469.1 hypothetical protein [Bifidobacterium mongoliense]
MAGHVIDSTAFNYQHESQSNREQTLRNINAAYRGGGQDGNTSAELQAKTRLKDILTTLGMLPDYKRREVMAALPSDVLAEVISHDVHASVQMRTEDSEQESFANLE